MLLRAKNITVHYGKAMAVDNVSLEVREGSLVAFHRRQRRGQDHHPAGLVRPASSSPAGEVWFQDKRIDGMRSLRHRKAGP
jgi:ABC-type branched-subunit amino acid transport system ATPase component